MKKQFTRQSATLLIALAILVVFTNCTNGSDFDKGKAQLENQGYTKVKDTGYSWMCCSDSDMFASGFTAFDKNGNKQAGCICSGFLKGITIRFK